ncbi:hypothetical protein J1605_012271 [Eschrichtius robustus]|uniref:Uncharacterized protein n=1 Tax=Eschrichtius robustus TaxID=9764 RepID=A0AB34GK61_ESCRO|nr:hypothetical protein J1605_012271 [Eschrichtius robustus]
MCQAPPGVWQRGHPAGEENLLAILRRRWWKYMILGLIDLEANYLVVKAYQYTTLTSIQVPRLSSLLIFLIFQM